MHAQRSLQALMSEMAVRADFLSAQLCPEHAGRPQPRTFTEIEAFISLDPLLAHLHKQFLDAKQNRKKLVTFNGADDPMLDVAEDLEDSAWCAVQTRLHELRGDKDKAGMAQKLVRQCPGNAEKEEEKDGQARPDYGTQARRHDRREARVLFEWVFLLWFLGRFSSPRRGLRTFFRPAAVS